MGDVTSVVLTLTSQRGAKCKAGRDQGPNPGPDTGCVTFKTVLYSSEPLSSSVEWRQGF